MINTPRPFIDISTSTVQRRSSVRSRPPPASGGRHSIPGSGVGYPGPDLRGLSLQSSDTAGLAAKIESDREIRRDCLERHAPSTETTIASGGLENKRVPTAAGFCPRQAT